MAGLVSAQMVLASGPDFPTINDFLPPEILFQGTPFAINRIMLVRIVMTLVILLVLGITALRSKLIPGRWQGAVEWMLDFIRNKIVYEVMGERRGRRYVPMITTMFLTIFLFNVCEVIPGANIAATATIAMPLVFAVWTFFQYWIAAAREQGLLKYLHHELIPQGVPIPVLIIVLPMQLLDVLIVRPVSLMVRLFANMLAGYFILELCLAATQYFLVDVTNKLMTPMGGFMLIAAFVMTLFESFVAALQAFIFATLTTVYINLSYPEEA
ncbi:MAG: F0F1 ATP synthase subunit A [Bifidobacterium sp.]|uniref:ATP synthase subunit a n=1 Tax=Bifidobacterium fermentum TaxID=3059035 RepID=A0AB39URI9_9BIFI